MLGRSLMVLLVGMAMTLLTESLSYGQISGLVFKDIDANGIRTLSAPIESGVPGVKIQLLMEGSTIPVETLTDANGAFSFSSAQAPAGKAARVTFYDLGQGYFSGVSGSQNSTTVQFVTAPTDQVRLAISSPGEYCGSSNPAVIVSCYVNGDPLAGGSAGEGTTLVKFPYLSSGVPSLDNVMPVNLAKAKEVGTVWGAGYHRRTGKLVTSAFVRRHTGLGSLGIGGLYTTDVNTVENKPFVDLASIGIDFGEVPHSGLLPNHDAPSLDSTTLRMVGKVGIGGFSFDERGEYLYVVNLFDRKVYQIFVGTELQVPTANDVRSFDIPSSCTTAADFRPWGIKVYRGEVYVSAVCSGESNRDTTGLKGSVYKFDPRESNSTPTEILSFPLTFRRNSPDLTPGCERFYWNHWDDLYPEPCNTPPLFAVNPQPILSDMEFDSNGDMILGIMDRFGLQSGLRNYNGDGTGRYSGFAGGDLMRAALLANGTYQIESNGIAGDLAGCGVGNGEGNGGGEYYCGDEWIFYGQVAHSEINVGSIVLLPGSNEIISTVIDPISDPNNNIFESSGWRVYANQGEKAGESIRSLLIYDQNYAGTFGKAAGLGDMVAACSASPIEIGNRVWRDTNRNGIQDPGEPGIGGVAVALYENNAQVASTTTDSQGQYYFNTSNVPGDLKYNQEYEIRISTGQAALTTEALVLVPAAASSNRLLDSDGLLNTGTNPYAYVLLTTGYDGENDHSFDFGFMRSPGVILTTDSLTICPETPVSLIAEVSNASATDSVLFVAYTTNPLTIEEKLTTGVVLGKVAPSTQGIAVLSPVQFPQNNTKDSLSYVVCALLVSADMRLLAYDSGRVVVQPVPVAIATVEDTLTCSNRLVQLRGNSNLSGVRYSWAGPNGFLSAEQNPRVAVEGVYVLTVTSRSGCVSLPDTAIVIEKLVPPVLPLPFVTICEPTNSVQLPPLQNAQEWVAAPGNPAPTTVSVSGLVSGLTTNGRYWIKIQQGFCVSGDSLLITRLPKPTIRVSPQELCGSSRLNLNSLLTGTSPLFNVTWYVGSVSGQNRITTPSNVPVSTTTTFFVRAENVEGCADTASVVVRVKPLPSATVLVDEASCAMGVARNDARLYIRNPTASTNNRFDYSLGQTYTGAATYSTASPIPNNGVLANNLANPVNRTFYTVRIFAPDGCFQDYTVSLLSIECVCPQTCAPVSVRIIRR